MTAVGTWLCEVVLDQHGPYLRMNLVIKMVETFEIA